MLLKRNRLTNELYAERRGGSSCSGVRGLKWVRWEGLAGERTGGSVFQSVEDEDAWSPVAMSVLVLLQKQEDICEEDKTNEPYSYNCQALDLHTLIEKGN